MGPAMPCGGKQVPWVTEFSASSDSFTQPTTANQVLTAMSLPYPAKDACSLWLPPSPPRLVNIRKKGSLSAFCHAYIWQMPGRKLACWRVDKQSSQEEKQDGQPWFDMQAEYNQQTRQPGTLKTQGQ